jgi:hypothetical protein
MMWDSGKLTAATVLGENKMKNRVGRGSLTTMYCNVQFYSCNESQLDALFLKFI